MPIYEYRCQKCGAEFEELSLSSSADATVSCRRCDSRRVVRLLSTFAVSANGGGGSAPMEPGGCGACGAPRRNMCNE